MDFVGTQTFRLRHQYFKWPLWEPQGMGWFLPQTHQGGLQMFILDRRPTKCLCSEERGSALSFCFLSNSSFWGCICNSKSTWGSSSAHGSTLELSPWIMERDHPLKDQSGPCHSLGKGGVFFKFKIKIETNILLHFWRSLSCSAHWKYKHYVPAVSQPLE